MPGSDDDRKPEQLPSKVRRDDIGYTIEEVAAHCSVDDGWIVVNSFVYDISNFVRHHPGWTLGGQTSTILSLTRNLGKDCTEEFISIHSGSAMRHLDDYMIGYLLQAGPSDSCLALANILLCLVQFIPAARDMLRLGLVSQEYFQALSAWMDSPAPASASEHLDLWAPLSLERCFPGVQCCEQYQDVRTVSGVKFQETAMMLGPRLWGKGSHIVPTQIEVVLKSYQAIGCVFFGVVPDRAFHQDPIGSRCSAYTFDGLGRLSVPGEARGKQVKRLFGERVTEGDHLSLVVRRAPGQRTKAQCSFLVNGRSLGVAFNLDADEAFSPVLYFYPMYDASALKIELPQHRNYQGRGVALSHRRGRVPQGLIFHTVGPDLTAWLDLPIKFEAFEELTVDDVKEQLATGLTLQGPASVSAQQITILLDGDHLDDGNQRLRECICYENGLHLERLQWHLVHLIS